jgi:DNA-binding PadR family transcriptional regulator
MSETHINPTAAALLGLLHEGPMTGGQLMAAAERRLGPYWSMTRSQVYRELPVLAEMGFVRGPASRMPSPPPGSAPSPGG